jgi:hypothetical protein
MSRRTGSLIAAIVTITTVPTAAQWLNYPTPGIPRLPDGKPNLSAPAPKTADGKPDLSGMWEMEHNRDVAPPALGCMVISREFVNIGSSLSGGLPYQPSAAQLVKTRQAQPATNPVTRCFPIGIVRTSAFPGFRKIIQVPGLMVILSEYNASYRQIFMDARPLPADPNPSWNGYSTGKWEGDTLVVQTAGFQDGIWLDASGNPLTDAAKITERFRRLDFGHLEIELTVDDSKAYTKPWTVKLNQIITLDTDLLDYICNENEKDIQHLVQK